MKYLKALFKRFRGQPAEWAAVADEAPEKRATPKCSPNHFAGIELKHASNELDLTKSTLDQCNMEYVH